MKTMKILVLFVSFSSYAQDPQLLDNTWYLQKIIIDDVEYYPPINAGVDNTFLGFFNDYNFHTTACSSILSDSIIITDDLFTVEEFIQLPSPDCNLPETIIFENLYFGDFFDAQHTNKTFNYNIETGADNIKTLILTNDLNYSAIYGNEILSNHDFDILSFNVYPNPSSDIINISSEEPINRIKVFDTLGRLVLEQNNPSSQMDVSSLSTGLLFIKIETDQGTLVKKIIKE
mgnify:CR=1 FL=1